MFFYQLKNELIKLFAKKRTYIGFGMCLLAQLLFVLFFHYRGARRLLTDINRAGLDAEQFVRALTVATLMTPLLVGILLPLYVALVGGDIVSKEAEDGTLRMILSRPISRLRLLCVKWTAGAIFSCALVIALGVAGLILSALWFPIKGGLFATPMMFGQEAGIFGFGEGLWRFTLAHILMTGTACSIMSLAFMFSCFNMKPAAATILALSLKMIDWILHQIPFFEDFRHWFLHHYLNCWQLAFQEHIPWWQVEQSLFVMLGFCLTVLVIGVTAFQVRDIKS